MLGINFNNPIEESLWTNQYIARSQGQAVVHDTHAETIMMLHQAVKMAQGPGKCWDETQSNKRRIHVLETVAQLKAKISLDWPWRMQVGIWQLPQPSGKLSQWVTTWDLFSEEIPCSSSPLASSCRSWMTPSLKLPRMQCRQVLLLAPLEWKAVWLERSLFQQQYEWKKRPAVHDLKITNVHLLWLDKHIDLRGMLYTHIEWPLWLRMRIRKTNVRLDLPSVHSGVHITDLSKFTTHDAIWAHVLLNFLLFPHVLYMQFCPCRAGAVNCPSYMLWKTSFASTCLNSWRIFCCSNQVL